MAMEIPLCLVLLALLVRPSAPQADPVNGVGYDEKYVQGLVAYNVGKWRKSIPLLRQSMDEFSRLEEARQYCYANCTQERSKVTNEWVELQFFECVLQRRQCIRHCVEERVGLVLEGGVPLRVLRNLKNREGLKYLHKAHQKLGGVREGAQAYAQYMYFHPRDGELRAQGYYYRQHIKVKDEDLIPANTLDYRESWEQGHLQYYSEDWAGMVESMESALLHFYQPLQHCRYDCLGPIKYSSNLGFYQALTVVHNGLVLCQESCPNSLGQFRSDKSDNFFASFFHYLQYGYYFMNRSVEAVQAAATRVRLDPTNEEARRSAVFYKQRPGVTSKDFKPRKDVLPEILKQEVFIKYRKLLDKLSSDVLLEREQKSPALQDDLLLLEEDFKRWPLSMLEHSTTQSTSAS